MGRLGDAGSGARMRALEAVCTCLALQQQQQEQQEPRPLPQPAPLAYAVLRTSARAPNLESSSPRTARTHQVELYVVQALALAQVVVVRRAQQPQLVAPDDGLQEPILQQEGRRSDGFIWPSPFLRFPLCALHRAAPLAAAPPLPYAPAGPSAPAPAVAGEACTQLLRHVPSR